MKHYLLPILICLLCGACNMTYRSPKKFAASNNAIMWNMDTCGMKRDRFRLSQKLLKHNKAFVGLSEPTLISIFGKPDFIYSYHTLRYGDALYYEYSMSSIEMINGKCGEPGDYSLVFAVDRDTHKLLGIQRNLY